MRTNRNRILLMFALCLTVFLFGTGAFAETITSGNYEYSLVQEYTNSGIVVKPQGFNYIGNETSVIVPSTIDGYKVESVYFSRKSVNSVVLSQGIEHPSFWDCSNLTSVSLPSSIKSLDGSFENCISLESITLPTGTYSCRNAFSGCKALREITINGTITNAYSMLHGCPDLEKFTLNGKIDGPVYLLFGDNKLTSVTLNGSMSGMPDNASTSFEPSIISYNNSIREITISGNLTDIDNIANNCTALEKVTIKGDISQSHNYYVFESCPSLKTVVIDGSILKGSFLSLTRDCPNIETFEITKKAEITSLLNSFSESKNLKSFIVPEGVEHLTNTFSKCINLETVYIPGTVKSINDAFLYCYNLKDIYFTGTQCQWDGMDIISNESNGDKLSQATIHKSNTDTSHTLNGGETIVKKPTCKEEGIKESLCTVCHKTIRQTIPKLTGHSYGDWTVTRKATVFAEGEQTRTCSICGDKQKVAVAKLQPVLKVGKSKLKIAKTKSVSLKATFAAGDSVTAKSSNKKIAVVSCNNSTIKITAKKKTGSATISVSTKSGKKATIKVTVPKAATKKITCKAVTIKKGKKATLKPVVTPSYNDDRITYKSANKKIASVTSKGVVKGISKGKTIITVKSGKKSVKVKVTVK